MKYLKYPLILALFAFVQLAQATCTMSLITAKSSSYSNNVFTSTFRVDFPQHDLTDICTVDNTNSKSIINLDGTTNNNYNLTDVVVTTYPNGFLTTDTHCWCNNTTGSPTTCNINIYGTNNTKAVSVNNYGVAFKKCFDTPSVYYELTYKWTLRSGTATSVKYCPSLKSTQNGTTTNDGNTLTASGTNCATSLPSTPTCALKVPSYVSLRSVKPVATAGTTLSASKAEVAIQLIDCTNNTGSSKTPRITFSDAGGRTTSCTLQNKAEAAYAAAAEIALFSDAALNTAICLNNTASNNLSYTAIANGSTVASQTKSIWAAITNTNANAVGAVQGSLMVKLDYL